MSSLDFIRTAVTGKQDIGTFIRYYSSTKNPVMAFKFARTKVALSDIYKKFNIKTNLDFNSLIDDIKNLNKILDTEKKKYNYGIGGGTKFNDLILYFLVKSLKPQIFIETGVAAGVSSYFILKAMQENKKGELISIDLPNYTNKKGYINKNGELDKTFTPKRKGVGWVVPGEFRNRWQLILGDSMKILPKINKRIDMFYHDSDHSYECMNFEYNWAMRNKVRYVASDDINCSKAWQNFINKNNLDSVNIEGFGFTKIRRK